MLIIIIIMMYLHVIDFITNCFIKPKKLNSWRIVDYEWRIVQLILCWWYVDLSVIRSTGDITTTISPVDVHELTRFQ
jgi:hypothetical protein